MPSYAMKVEVGEGEADDLAALLLEAGAMGAEIRGGAVAPMPGVAPPPLGRAHVIASFEARELAEAAAARLGLVAEVAEVADQDWSESWKRGLEPFVVGRVFIRPSWTTAAPPAGAVEVVLDPGMAFGTGTHATTALCLEGICELLQLQPGAHVLDVGTGSGLLAIAAAKLGAAKVVATEVDATALAVAAENAARNGVALELGADLGDVSAGPFPLIVANILANTLAALARPLAARLAPGGAILLSGILGGQEGEVGAAYQAEGLRPAPDLDRSRGEWRLVGLRRPVASGEGPG